MLKNMLTHVTKREIVRFEALIYSSETVPCFKPRSSLSNPMLFSLASFSAYLVSLVEI